METRIVTAAFRLLTREAWRDMTLASVARSAKVSWDEIFRTAPSRAALAGAMLRRTAADTAKYYKPERTSRSERERVFDVIMSWFDAQAGRKEAIRALYIGLKQEPLMLLALRNDVIAGGEWLLALAEVDAGPTAQVRAIGIGGIVARALPVWLSDDEAMGKTMAQIDGDLRRIERLLGGAEKSKPQKKKRRKS
jgi:AcrR family transcriptional regulator